MKEVWKDIHIEGFNSVHQVSNLGRVKRLAIKSNKTRGNYDRPERIIKPYSDKRGYCGLNLQYRGKKVRRNVHRLVAQAFIPNPENKPEVNHINGNKSDNRVENLEWCTSSENQIHAFKELGVRSMYGENHVQSKLTEEHVRNIRLLYAMGGISQKKLSDYYGLSQQSIHEAIVGKTWKHV